MTYKTLYVKENIPIFKYMILNDKIVNKIVNSDYIKEIYPMLDHIETKMDWDGDEEFPFYDLELNMYLNDPDINTFNMYEKGFDPHYLVDEHLMFIFKMAGLDRPSAYIHQIYIKVIAKNGDLIYPRR